MKFYIAEDDTNIIRILKKIITDRDLGTVIGEATDGYEAYQEIEILKPDIALVDLFIPSLDGISLVQKMDDSVSAIMISQVSAKDMIERAYEAGVKFFIQKPINAVEVCYVIEHLIENIESQKKLEQIKSMLASVPEETQAETFETRGNSNEDQIISILKSLGIIGESGADAIITSISWLIDHPNALNEMSLKDFFQRFSDHPRSFEQRIRRTASTALNNLASMGLEDYSNPIFQDYAHVLYSFKEIRIEMDGIKKKVDEHGTVNIRKFLEGLLHICIS
ncbi:two-component system, response regulator YcbB [Dethiosulfatibacter aminovorans DSM 17477]|uniref:Two-component system, response regulator YcbB n=1 Tax=Dethiosulfatibacter aminovorans DSM 17477 TaxID=1121476 RepID=A0A1M6GMW3_9FIRM|nr:DNA-binding domain-containing protein [Dethiosulfatibacter aminovorans]SHJ11216.1 two-component system, response regulator YcbB [Dethiosulfatibacter aminovorans DSM 17477]